MDDREQCRAELHSPDKQTRAAAVEKLSLAGPAAAWAAVELVRACGDESPVCDSAVAALESLGPPPLAALPQLAELATAPAALPAYWSITLLGRLGPDAHACQDTLAKVLMESPDQASRERAAWALGKIGADSKVAVSALEQAANSSEPRLARLATASLQELRK